MSIKKLEELVNTLSTYIDKKEVVNETISKAPVGWHLQHTFLAIDRIISQMQLSNSAEYKPSFSFAKMIVFAMGKIPRGRGKSPKAVNPTEVITTETIKSSIAKATQKINQLSSLQPNQFFNHPYFGKLKTAPAIKFLTIHTNHHLNIVNDILAK
jgi:hypothetical protein